MMQLHAAARGRDVALEQVRVVGLILRLPGLIVALVVGVITVPMVVDIVHGNAATWFDSADWSPLGFIAFLAPFAVWQKEKRFGPAFLWTLPVDRSRLALARAFAGWVWVMTALAGFIIWQRALAAVSGVNGARVVPLIAFSGVTALYLFGSALVLGLRHPLRWLLGTVGVFVLVATLNEALGRTPAGEARMFAWSAVLRWSIYGPYGIDKLLSSRSLRSAVEAAGTATATILWIGAGLAVLWAAISRHRENR